LDETLKVADVERNGGEEKGEGIRVLDEDRKG